MMCPPSAHINRLGITFPIICYTKELQSPAPPCRIQNPSAPQNTPLNTPRIPSQKPNTKLNTKNVQKSGVSVIFSHFFCVWFRERIRSTPMFMGKLYTPTPPRISGHTAFFRPKTLPEVPAEIDLRKGGQFFSLSQASFVESILRPHTSGSFEKLMLK